MNLASWGARVAGVALLLALHACGTAPRTPAAARSLTDIPANWSATGPGSGGSAYVSLASWWQRFDDPMLDALVTGALQANTSVNGAQAALGQAQASRALAAAGLWPSLGSSASAEHGTAGGHSTGNSFRLGLDANWALDVFGANRAGVDAADATVAASNASLGDVQVQVAAEVALNYILLRTAQARSGIASDNLASQRETLQITLWRQQAGLVSALEAEQARAAVAQNLALLPSLQTSASQAGHALAVLSGRPPAALPALLVPPQSTDAIPQVRRGLTASIPAETLRQRADVRAAEYRVAAALARVDQAHAQRWPSFAIGGSLGLSALTAAALTNGASVVGSLLASVSLPIFDGGSARAQVRLQQAALAEAEQVYRATVLGALKDVEDALVALGNDRLRLDSLLGAADAATRAALLARQRYGSGLVDFQTVLETQRTQFATQDGVLSARADLGGDHVRLFKALGGGWPPPP